MNLKRLLINFIYEKKLIFLLTGSKVTIEKGGVFKLGKNVKIYKSTIYVKKGDSLIIGDYSTLSRVSLSMILGGKSEIYIGKNCSIEEFDMSVTKGYIHIDDNNILSKGGKLERPHFEVEGGLKIGSFNSLRCCAWIRFNGQVEIGSRNAINEGTEIRCDEHIIIGDYNQISYDCVFWDTNTHVIYKAEKRREITDSQYPEFGMEFEKPKTTPIAIGSDCWIGKGVSVLKGTNLADKCIVGYGTLLSNIKVSENKTIFNQPHLKIIDNQL
ncbi:hypothetical protein [Litoribaculum gwangyangense]|jgi:acetyltransferase-like isoleucine patch superfamily enzyme|uniref:Acyltransferase n=1 Tax=Litoribaculum gwangyangense TaxID=1130722 RepID=A0ABP9CV55_9FLAO